MKKKLWKFPVFRNAYIHQPSVTSKSFLKFAGKCGISSGTQIMAPVVLVLYKKNIQACGRGALHLQFYSHVSQFCFLGCSYSWILNLRHPKWWQILTFITITNHARVLNHLLSIFGTTGYYLLFAPVATFYNYKLWPFKKFCECATQ